MNERCDVLMSRFSKFYDKDKNESSRKTTMKIYLYFISFYLFLF